MYIYSFIFYLLVPGTQSAIISASYKGDLALVSNCITHKLENINSTIECTLRENMTGSTPIFGQFKLYYIIYFLYIYIYIYKYIVNNT